ncbi:MAG: hypothetical protein JW821_16770 [Deltaproteobacteria bacterium]|nr:hypothetical protein [Deltaproteobacteria bacterium]
MERIVIMADKLETDAVLAAFLKALFPECEIITMPSALGDLESCPGECVSAGP